MLVLLAVQWGASLLVAQTNLVLNPGFEIPKPTSHDYTYVNPQVICYHPVCANGMAAHTQAQTWTLWLGIEDKTSCVMTELVKAGSQCIPFSAEKGIPSGNMMHVKTTYPGAANTGIVNTDIPAGNSKVKITAWVYVLKGKVKMGYGPTGNIMLTTSSKYNCRWEKLEITKTTDSACNQLTLYADGGDTEFYVDAVSVVKI